jgi:hypothetical protein
MSRDHSSQDWAEAILSSRRLEFEELERYVGYVRQQAYYEGLTAHLRPGQHGTPFHECPWCSSEELDLKAHLLTCEEVPPELRGEE